MTYHSAKCMFHEWSIVCAESLRYSDTFMITVAHQKLLDTFELILYNLIYVLMSMSSDKKARYESTYTSMRRIKYVKNQV